MKRFEKLGYEVLRSGDLVLLKSGDVTIEINLEKETVKKYYKSKYTDGLSIPMDLTFAEIGLLGEVFLGA